MSKPQEINKARKKQIEDFCKLLSKEYSYLSRPQKVIKKNADSSFSQKRKK